VRTEEYKYVETMEGLSRKLNNYNERALYNIKRDPFEEVNLLTMEIPLKTKKFSIIADRLKDGIYNIEEVKGDKVTYSEDRQEIEATLKHLKELGYVD
jgi:hypothetical protein